MNNETTSDVKVENRRGTSFFHTATLFYHVTFCLLLPFVCSFSWWRRWQWAAGAAWCRIFPSIFVSLSWKKPFISFKPESPKSYSSWKLFKKYIIDPFSHFYQMLCPSVRLSVVNELKTLRNSIFAQKFIVSAHLWLNLSQTCFCFEKAFCGEKNESSCIRLLCMRIERQKAEPEEAEVEEEGWKKAEAEKLVKTNIPLMLFYSDFMLWYWRSGSGSWKWIRLLMHVLLFHADSVLWN